MILYKYRSLDQLDFTLDILVNQRLFCSEYENLNDPFEGQFPSIISNNEFPLKFPFNFSKEETSLLSSLRSKEIAVPKICSLSADIEDVKMWSFYANSHKGIAIAIELDETDQNIFKINYKETIHSYLNLPKAEEVKNILTSKTNHWCYENEYRILSNDKYFSINGKIKKIILGFKISEFHKELLESIILDTYETVETGLDHNNSKVIII